MQLFNQGFSRFLLVVMTLFVFALPMQSQAEELEETPSAIAMAFDGLIVRPLTLVATVAGTAIWVVTLPFSLLGGNAGEAAEQLVLYPAKATFVRCLGCKMNNRKVDFADEESEEDYE